jgi:hypothetical protein
MKTEDKKVLIVILVLLVALALVLSTIVFPGFWANFYKGQNQEFEGELASLSGKYCTDSEGKDYSVSGNVQTNAGNFQDSCTDDKTLKEYYCKGRYSAYLLYTCPNVCSGGKCI